MAIESGVATLFNSPTPYRWRAYRTQEKLYIDAIESDGQECTHKSTGYLMVKAAPFLRKDPATPNQVQAFFANENGQLSICNLAYSLDGDNLTAGNSNLQRLQRTNDDGSTGHLYTKGISIITVPGGMVTVTSDSEKKNLFLDMFSDIDLANPTQSPVATVSNPVNFDTSLMGDADFNLYRAMATIVNSVEDDGNGGQTTGTRLILSSKTSATTITIVEFRVEAGFEVTQVSAPVLLDLAVQNDGTNTNSIKTNIPGLTTSTDGRARITLYEGDPSEQVTHGNPVLSQFTRHLDIDSKTSATTVSWKYNGKISNDVNSKDVTWWTTPTVTCVPDTPDRQVDEDPRRQRTQATIHVNQQFGVVYNTSDIDIHSKGLGTVWRKPLDTIDSTANPPTLLAVVRGTPPVSNAYIQSDALDANKVQSSLAIVLTHSATGGTRLTTSYGVSLNVGASISVGVALPGATLNQTTEYSFAIGTMFESVYEGYETATMEQTLVADADTTALTNPDGEDQPWVRPSGTAFLFRTGIAGYVYFFANEGSDVTSASGLPHDAIVFYEYTATRAYLSALPYDIVPPAAVYDSDDRDFRGMGIPGVLDSYTTQAHLDALDGYDALQFEGGTSKPQIAWTYTGASAEVTAAFSKSTQTTSTQTLNITSSMKDTWSAEIKFGLSIKASVWAEISAEFSYGETVVDKAVTSTLIDAAIDTPAFKGNDAPPCRSYSTVVYVIKPPDDSKQNTALVDDWITTLKQQPVNDSGERLGETPDNSYLLGLVNKGGTNQLTGSNPFFVDYVVEGLNPDGLEDPIPPQALFMEGSPDEDVDIRGAD